MSIDQSKSEVTALTDKFKKFGVLGAGLVRAPVALSPAESETALTATSTPSIESVQPVQITQMTASDVASLLREMAEFQLAQRKAIIALTSSLYDSVAEYSFSDLYEQVLALGFDKNPCESRGITDSDLNGMTMKYQESEEVIEAAQMFMSSQQGIEASESAISQAEVKSIDMNKILKIHKTMNDTFISLVKEFSALPEETRHTFIPRLVESTAEVCVALETYKKFGLKSEVIEEAIADKLEELEKSKKYQQETMQLAETMKELYSWTKPRLSKSEFLDALSQINENAKTLKSLSTELYDSLKDVSEDDSSKCNRLVRAAYSRFIAFTEDQSKSAILANPFEAKDLLERLLKSATVEEKKAIQDAWDESGLELSLFMQAVMMAQQDPSMGLPPPPPSSLFKRKDLPSEKDVLNLQEALVNELRGIKAKIEAAVGVDANGYRQEHLVGFAQALATGHVERMFGFSSESLTLGGFRHGMSLSRNQKFVEASMGQQTVLGEIAQLVPESNDDSQGNGQSGGCSIM